MTSPPSSGDTPPAFGDLRSLLQEGPARWSDITRMIDAFEGSDTFAEHVLPYVRDHIARWTEDTPTPPERWKARALSGEDVPALALFHKLDLKHRPVSREALFRLAELPCLTHIRALDLERCHLDAATVLEFFERDPFPALEILRLNQNDLSGAASTSLLSTSRVTGLHSLGLRACKLRDSSIEALVSSDYVWTLQDLKLGSNPLTARGFELLANAENLLSLRSIDIGHAGLGARALDALHEATWLKQLRWLNCSLEDLSHDSNAMHTALLRFLSNKALENLSCLILSGEFQHTEVARFIASTPHFSKLEHLGFGGYPSERLVASIAPERRLQHAPGHEVARAGARAIIESAHLSDAAKRYWRIMLQETA